jgi:hypothetical protein
MHLQLQVYQYTVHYNRVLKHSSTVVMVYRQNSNVASVEDKEDKEEFGC